MESLRPVLILDFGSQYTQLITRRIREMKVYSVVVPCTTPFDEIQKMNPTGVILSGGPNSVYDAEAPVADEKVFSLQVPVLGICFGLHWMVKTQGGKVKPAEQREYGLAQLEIENSSRLLKGLPSPLRVWNSHGDEAETLPPGFDVAGRTENTVSVIENPGRNLYAVAFHPEVRHTDRGGEILQKFVFDICGAQRNWTHSSFIEDTVGRIRQKVGESAKAVCALSGGVDSTVAATLVHRAIGERLTCVFVDNGLLRHNELKRVSELLRDQFHLEVHAVDASARFLKRLEGVSDPEKKRKIIGEEFIRVFEEEATRWGEIDYLVQGTLYPDVIESVSVKGPAATIKSHHNVGGLPEKLRFKLIEPLRELFKDEVRAVGLELGLSEEILWQHPFPGPGLAVRIAGEITPERLRRVREADRIVLEEIRQAGFYRKLWQAFAVLLPVSSVGVMGDARSYGSTISLRAVESDDGMTADWARLPPELLQRIATRIVNEVKGINRVVYDITSKPPGTIEWE
ncbi:MAG: glutamine-hydrolyzing GMP synthase [Acidobacteria bacterium]|nr:glutamine-hydrolyzing GMP synthase [Acidobacteriota bacterium]